MFAFADREKTISIEVHEREALSLVGVPNKDFLDPLLISRVNIESQEFYRTFAVQASMLAADGKTVHLSASLLDMMLLSRSSKDDSNRGRILSAAEGQSTV